MTIMILSITVRRGQTTHLENGQQPKGSTIHQKIIRAWSNCSLKVLKKEKLVLTHESRWLRHLFSEYSGERFPILGFYLGSWGILHNLPLNYLEKCGNRQEWNFSKGKGNQAPCRLAPHSWIETCQKLDCLLPSVYMNSRQWGRFNGGLPAAK